MVHAQETGSDSYVNYRSIIKTLGSVLVLRTKTTLSKDEAYILAVYLIKKSALESNKFSQILFFNNIQYR